jgi:hypothetical protein
VIYINVKLVATNYLKLDECHPRAIRSLESSVTLGLNEPIVSVGIQVVLKFGRKLLSSL